MSFRGVIYNELVSEYISIQSVYKISHCKIKVEIPLNTAVYEKNLKTFSQI